MMSRCRNQPACLYRSGVGRGGVMRVLNKAIQPPPESMTSLLPSLSPLTYLDCGFALETVTSALQSLRVCSPMSLLRC
jgi:hypothetical protein